MDVALFIPCLVDQCAPQAGLATARLLKHLDVTVHYPREQTCCGQPMYNSGFPKEAAALAERFVQLFSRYEYVVSPSGSCTGMVRHFYRALPMPASLQQDVAALEKKTYELTEFLVEVLHLQNIPAEFPHRVAYHPSCHQNRELRTAQHSVDLLKKVKDLSLVNYEISEACCGFGGTFSVLFPEVSKAMGGDKLKAMAAAGAEYVTSTDTGCLMQLKRVRERNLSMPKPIHVAEILASNL